MAETRTRRSFRHNLLPIGKDKLAKNALGAPTNGSHTPIPTPAAFWAQTPASTPAQASAPAPTISSTDKLYQQLMKTYAATVKLLEQNQAQGASPHKQSLKV